MVPATPLLHPPGVTAATRRPLQSTASSAAGAGSGSGKELEGVEMMEVVKVAAVVRCPASRVPSGRLRAAGGSSCHHSAAPARPSSRPRHGAGRGRHTSGRGGAASPSCSSQDTLEPGPGTHTALLPSTTTTSPGTKVVVVVEVRIGQYNPSYPRPSTAQARRSS